jgi:hypothetical protein
MADTLVPPAATPRRPFFCFTLDTEPDDLWSDRPTLRFDHFERLPAFHRELAERGARPTYLTTSEVAEHRTAARALTRILDTGRAEVGAHFHTWTRSWPFAVPDLGSPPVHATAMQLGGDVEERMLDYTCTALERELGVRPVSHRGGRWSLNGASVRSLRNCGIRVDSTVTPGLSWVDAAHPLKSGPDFRTSPRRPHYLAGESLQPRASGDVLELPVGASFHPGRRTAVGRGPWARLRRGLGRLVGRPAGVLWLRPTLMSRRQGRLCLEQLRRDRVSVWVAMIHSSEIGPNRYFPTEEEVAQFRRRCLELVEDAVALGAVPATLEEVWQFYQDVPSAPAGGELSHAAPSLRGRHRFGPGVRDDHRVPDRDDRAADREDLF